MSTLVDRASTATRHAARAGQLIASAGGDYSGDMRCSRADVLSYNVTSITGGTFNGKLTDQTRGTSVIGGTFEKQPNVVWFPEETGFVLDPDGHYVLAKLTLDITTDLVIIDLGEGRALISSGAFGYVKTSGVKNYEPSVVAGELAALNGRDQSSKNRGLHRDGLRDPSGFEQHIERRRRRRQRRVQPAQISPCQLFLRDVQL